MRKRNNGGFVLIEVVLLALVLAVAGFVVYKSVSGKPSSATSSKPAKPPLQADTPPLKLKSISFNLDFYDPGTNQAGDMVFTHEPIFDDEIWADFGQQDPRTPDPTKKNPQPVFILPLHTKVHSLVDGVVVKAETLYSSDYTIWVAQDASNDYFFETEHVDNPIVKVGDKVKGGQIIGEVSSHDSGNHPGFGLVEIGILHPHGTQAGHLCPFKFLDDSVKADLQKKIPAIKAAWEKYLGKTVYKESDIEPGCVTEDWVQG